jgi:hypothetical protein
LTPLPPAAEPDEFAVPNVFVPGVMVPGASGLFAELPAPLGSLPALSSPAAFAGPDGTPFMP